MGCLTEKMDLHVCPKSKIISKKPKSIVSAKEAEIEATIQNCQDGEHLNSRRIYSSHFFLFWSLFAIPPFMFLFLFPKFQVLDTFTMLYSFFENTGAPWGCHKQWIHQQKWIPRKRKPQFSAAAIRFSWFLCPWKTGKFGLNYFKQYLFIYNYGSYFCIIC